MSARRIHQLTRLALGLCAALVLAACGEESEPSGVGGASVVAQEAVEGEPLELGDLGYNVGITRFLNPDDPEDSEYLVGQRALEPGTNYLGVFLTIENQTEIERPSASQFTVTDTLETEYDVLDSESPYALDVGALVPAEGELPLPDTTAATGPNHGSLLTFLVDDSVSENRPLRLVISSSAGSGEILLDI